MYIVVSHDFAHEEFLPKFISSDFQGAFTFVLTIYEPRWQSNMEAINKVDNKKCNIVVVSIINWYSKCPYVNMHVNKYLLTGLGKDRYIYSF